MRRVSIAVIALAFGLTALAGCGDDNGGGGLSGLAGGGQNEQQQPPPEEGAPGLSGGSEVTASPPAAAGGEGGTEGQGAPEGGGSSDQYCAAAQEMGQAFGSMDPTQANEELITSFQNIAAVAPPDIKPQWDAFVSSYQEVMAASENVSDPAKSAEALEKMQAASTELTNSAQAIQQHLLSACS